MTARGLGTMVIGGMGIVGGIWGIVLAPEVVAVAVAVATPPFIFYKKYLVGKATNKMRNFKGVVIGITGSYGKSSTKELVKQVLGSRFQVLATEKNVNSEIGVAQTVLKNLQGDEDFFVVEMGAYKIGEIADICRIVRPKVGIITGISDQHMALFGSLENIKRAKYELIDSLPPDGIALVADKDFSIRDIGKIRVFWDRTEFEYKETRFAIKIMGKALVPNVIAAIKMGEHFGLSLKDIAVALSAFNGLKIEKRSEMVIVDNSYNNSKEGFLAAIDYLQCFKNVRKIVVTAGIIELGANAQSDHEEIGKALRLVDKVYVTSKKYFNELNLSGNAVLSTDFSAETSGVILLQGRTSVKL